MKMALLIALAFAGVLVVDSNSPVAGHIHLPGLQKESIAKLGSDVTVKPNILAVRRPAPIIFQPEIMDLMPIQRHRPKKLNRPPDLISIEKMESELYSKLPSKIKNILNSRYRQSSSKDNMRFSPHTSPSTKHPSVPYMRLLQPIIKICDLINLEKSINLKKHNFQSNSPRKVNKPYFANARRLSNNIGVPSFQPSNNLNRPYFPTFRPSIKQNVLDIKRDGNPISPVLPPIKKNNSKLNLFKPTNVNELLSSLGQLRHIDNKTPYTFLPEVYSPQLNYKRSEHEPYNYEWDGKAPRAYFRYIPLLPIPVQNNHQ